jgi:dethiobiotin synthetase
LLTAEAVANRGLKLAGWVANHVDPRMAAVEENVRTLEMLIPAPLLAHIAFTATPDIAISAALLDMRMLD